MPDIYEVSHVIHDVIEVTLQPEEKRVVEVGYTPNHWRVYTKSVAFRAGWVSCLPGLSAPDARALKLLPNMVLNIPARGPALSLANLAGLTEQYYRLVAGATVYDSADSYFGVGKIHPTQPEYWAAQSFLVDKVGELAKIEVVHAALTGGIGTMTYEIRADYPGKPGAVLQSAEYTPVQGAVNNLSVSNGVSLDNQRVWLALRPTVPQLNAGNMWGWTIQGNVYPDGNAANTNTQWSTSIDQPSYDCRCALTIKGPGDFVPVSLVIEVS